MNVSPQSDLPSIEVASPGLLSVADLNAVIDHAWLVLMSEPESRKEIEEILGLAELSADLPPVRAKRGNSGSIAGDVVVYLTDVFAAAVMARYADTTLKALEAKVRTVWKRRLRPKVSPPSSENLGREKKDVD